MASTKKDIIAMLCRVCPSDVYLSGLSHRRPLMSHSRRSMAVNNKMNEFH